jgi:Glyoxalase-like domain
MARRIQVVIDCADPDGLATFWAQALGYKKQDPPEGYATWRNFETAQGVAQAELNSWHAVVDPDGAGPRLYFHRVPEPKVGKNRLHLDLEVARDVSPEEYRQRIDTEAERLRQVGATRLRAVEEHGEYWVTMLDPEGNEFDLM